MRMLVVERLSDGYENLFRSVFSRTAKRVREGEGIESHELPAENVLQGLWRGAGFGECFVTTGGDKVRLLDVGSWNRSAGPDFLGARFLLGGKVVTADVELDSCPEDWERHGHGSNENFNQVGLHVVFSPSGKEWFTRNSRHEEVPMVLVPPSQIKAALGKPIRSDVYKGAKCREPLASMPDESVHSLMLAAASYRWKLKGAAFRRAEELFGKDQALYESLAETFGYSRNKFNMRLLAQRIPLSRIIHDSDAEAILFGAAGFLVPYLPESTTPSAQGLHRRLWETWWKRREEFELNEERRIRWDMASVRPSNRPERRLSALTLAVAKWKDLRVLFNEPSKNVRSILETFVMFSHAYWSRHVSLPGTPLQSILALVGKERISDYLVNHLLPAENSDRAWEEYLKLVAGSRSEAVKEMALKLFGESRDLKKILKYSWQHQALLQLYKDFCLETYCEACPFPEQLKQWR